MQVPGAAYRHSSWSSIEGSKVDMEEGLDSPEYPTSEAQWELQNITKPASYEQVMAAVEKA